MTGTNEALTWLSAIELRSLVLSGQLSVTEVTRHFLDRITSVDPSLHSFLTVAAEQAMEDAESADRSVHDGSANGPLFGVPISIKDIFWTRGLRTTAGSLVFRDFVPDQDAVVVERVRAAGAILVGKTNLPEFALFPRTKNRLGPECVNPWDLFRTCGGSSGGAAASVAAGLTPLAVASDGGGSTRIPAALCGTVGIYPSLGRVPKHGGFGGTLFFSSAGPITRTVGDAALLLGVLAGQDARDPSSSAADVPDYLADLDRGMRGARVLWTADRGEATGSDPRVEAAALEVAKLLADAGVAIDDSAEGLNSDEWVDAFYTIMHVDRYASIGQQVYEDPAKRSLLSDYARDHFERARSITAVEYSRALQTRFRLIAWFDQLFTTYDFIVTPTVGIVAPSLDTEITRRPLVGNTFMVNYAGCAAATVPCGMVDGMPVGLQVIAPAGHESELLAACRVIEQLRPWVASHPPESGTSVEQPSLQVGSAVRSE